MLMLTVVDYPARDFRIWRYMTSFSQLLLRSAKKSDIDKQIDVLLAGVEWLNIPVFMSGFTMSRAQSVKDVEALSIAWHSSYEPNWAFAVSGRNYSGYIIAADFDLDISGREYNEPDKWGIYSGLKPSG